MEESSRDLVSVLGVLAVLVLVLGVLMMWME